MTESIRDRWNPELLRSLGRLDFIAREVLEGIRQGAHHGVRRGFSTEFFDYKEYQPGDDAWKIDWRLYAKTRKFFVKRFEAETSLECVVTLDLSPSMSWRWKDAINKAEYCAVLAASLGMLLIEQRDLVGLLAFGDGGNRYLAPRATLKQLNAFFAMISESARPGKSNSMLESAHDLRSIHRHRGLIIVLSDLEVPEQEAMETLSALRAGGDEVILFHVLDQAEITLPFDASTHFVDSETGQLHPVNLPALKKNHAQRIAEFREMFSRECRGNRITYVPVDTATSYVKAIAMMDQRRREFLH